MKKWQALLLTALVLALLAVALWFFWTPLLAFLNLQSGPLVGADALVSLLIALGALAAGVYAFLSRRDEHKNTPRAIEKTVDTGGGAYIGGSVHTGGGDFTGRDKKG